MAERVDASLTRSAIARGDAFGCSLATHEAKPLCARARATDELSIRALALCEGASGAERAAYAIQTRVPRRAVGIARAEGMR
jgi:hypothetical protein